MNLAASDAVPCLGSAAGRASFWIKRWTHLVRPGGIVLDVACGEGRHLAWFAAHGHRVVGVDRSPAALQAVTLPEAQCHTVCADIEQDPWPLTGQHFDAVVVTNYLWRALLPTLAESLAPGGVLIYETFACGQETIGRPSREDFLLQPGELLRAFSQLRTVAFEDGFEAPADGASAGRFVQRITAVRPPLSGQVSTGTPPARYALQGPGSGAASE